MLAKVKGKKAKKLKTSYFSLGGWSSKERGQGEKEHQHEHQSS